MRAPAAAKARAGLRASDYGMLSSLEKQDAARAAHPPRGSGLARE